MCRRLHVVVTATIIVLLLLLLLWLAALPVYGFGAALAKTRY